jgi:hypothetical protein
MKTIKPLLVLPVLLLAAACAGPGGAGGSASGGSAQHASDASVPGFATENRAAVRRAARPGAGADGRPAVMQRAVISHGSIEMRSRDVARTRDDVLRLLHRWDGQVANEETGSDTKGRMTSVSLQLRVPSQDFDAAMADLPKVAHTVHQEISSQDVTTQVIDTDARLRAKEDSIRRIEALLAHAKNLNQIIAIETDLGDRQAELDSLKQQQAWLSDQTSLSTINVDVSRTAPVVHHQRHHSGLLAGLATGWHALAAAGLAALTVIGFLLPFAAVLALLGVPGWLAWRRWGRKPAPPTESAA